MADDQSNSSKPAEDSKSAGDGSPKNKPERPQVTGGPPEGRRFGPNWFFLIAVLGIGLMVAQFLAAPQAALDYTTFWGEVEKGNVSKVVIMGRMLTGEFEEPPLAPVVEGEEASAEPREPLPKQFLVTLGPRSAEALEAKLLKKGVPTTYQQPFDFNALFTFIWLILLVAMGVWMWSTLRRGRDQMMGGGMLGNVTKSPARLFDAESGKKTTFDDVAGLIGVKKDLKEIVEFLKEPEKFAKLGARVPKGVLLSGPPGTGKTLLARAVAGEAGVPFFSINGSEFIQLFVGVGASRVRDMFKTAKKQAPAILFIDEIDAVGRQRGAGMGGGHDEREQTLNQILSEMDGFSSEETVIVIAATNRPDVLDPALLRPGRFDRHVVVDRPTIKGREELFEVHSRNVPIADTVDFAKLARATVGMTGADIMNLVNEAALWATRQDKSAVDTDDFEYARDKALMGDTREDILTDSEKEVTAYHEAGHAVLGWLIPSGNRVHKVTIIPRGRALGVTQYVPEEDRHNMSESEMRARLAMGLGGRAAEEIVFNEFSAGAENDLQQGTRLARRMVTHWGMSERLGPIAYHGDHSDPFLGREMAQSHRPYSEHTAQVIDEEVGRILREAEALAEKTLADHRDKLEAVAQALLEREEIDDVELEELIGPAVKREDSPLAPKRPEPFTKK